MPRPRGWRFAAVSAHLPKPYSRRFTVTLVPSGDGTDLVIHHDRFGRADAEARHAAGWSGAIEQLEALLKAGGVTHGHR